MPDLSEIVLAGHICVDISTDLADLSGVRPGTLIEVGPVALSPGGSIANTGGTLLELGVPIRMSGAIADDELGQTLRALLAAGGMPTAGLQVSAAAGTSYSIVLQTSGTDRAFLHYPGANAHFDPNIVDVANASLVHFGYPSLMAGLLAQSGEPIRALLERAHSGGATTSIDFAVVDPGSPVAALDWVGIFEHVMPLVDVASPSLDDLTSALKIDEPFSAELVERLAQYLIDAGVAIVALSAGANGVYLKAATADRLRRGGAALDGLADQWANVGMWQPPLPLREWSSTNGAGDALTAGLLFALWSGMGPRDALETATAAATARISGSTVSRAALRDLLGSQSPSGIRN